MAKADIQLGINTKFDGDGLKKLDAGMKNAAKGARSASQALGAISGELGKVGGAAGKATSAISGMVGSLSGGPWAVAISAIVTAIGFIVKAFNDAKEAAKEAANTVRDSFNTALNQTQEKLSGILKLFQLMKKETNINASSATTDVQVAGSREQSEIQRRHIQARQNMTNDYDKARDRAAEARELSIARNDQQLKESQINIDKLRMNLSAANGEVSTIEKSLGEKREQIETQFANTVDKNVQSEYQKLQDNLSKWQTALKDNGADATAFTELRMKNVGQGSVAVKEEVSYKEAVERAAKALNEFKDDNEEALKSIEAYNESLKNLKSTEDQLAEAKVNAKQAQTDYENAQKKHTALQEKLTVDGQKLDEAYKEQITNINKQEQAADEAAKKKLEAEEKARQAEEARATKEQNRNQLLNKIEQKEEERATKVEAANKAMQQLNDREKTLSQELRKAEEAARNLTNGFDAAAEIARGLGKGMWQAGVGQAGGVNQWIGNNDRAQNAAWKEARRLQANQRQAEQHQGELANRVFDENGNVRKHANLLDVGRFADVSDFLGGKNLTDMQKKGLQAQADALREKFFDENGQLRKGVNPASRDLKQLQKLDSLLGKVKKVDDLKKKQEEMKKLEEQKKKLQEETAKATKSMDANIKEIRKQLKDGMTI